MAIATLTLNPAIDGSSEARSVGHTRKIRTSNERIYPGGDGINVARVLTRLGSGVEAVVVAGDTRINLAVHERETGKEYRFVQFEQTGRPTHPVSMEMLA
jgi:6-phosphofructokinase 2